jgi:chlorophyllide a oxygenase
VDEASRKLQATQDRVQQNLDRVAQLKAEAAALEQLSLATPSIGGGSSSSNAAALQQSEAAGSSAAPSAAAAKNIVASTAVLDAPAARSSTSRSNSSSSSARQLAPARAPAAAAGSGRPRPDRGLRSSLDAEPALKEFWYPAEFSSKLVEGMMVPFELFDEPWVLFR